MAFAKAADLRRIGSRLAEGTVKLAKSIDAHKDVFVSHSRLDRELVMGVYQVLCDHGANPYVDWADTMLQQVANKVESAAVVRRRIATCGRLVLIMSDQGASSGWMPWELGVADGMHSRERVVTFPVVTTAQATEAWAKKEYLGVYPYIDTHAPSGSTEYIVQDPADNKHWKLREWLKL